MIVRLALLAVFIVPIAGCNEIANIGKRELPLRISWYFSREDLPWPFYDDYYRVHLSFYHEAPNSVAGKYVVRAFGDVYGEGGQENEGVGDNYEESEFLTFAPGKANAFEAVYYINNPSLKTNDIPPKKVKEVANIVLTVEFIPSSDDPSYRRSVSKFVISNGDGNFE